MSEARPTPLLATCPVPALDTLGRALTLLHGNAVTAAYYADLSRLERQLQQLAREYDAELQRSSEDGELIELTDYLMYDPA